MNKNSTKYTFIFALIVCVVCSFALALVSEGLRPKRELNEAYDVKKNILSALNCGGVAKETTMADMMNTYQQMVEEIVVDERGNVIDGKAPEDIVDGDKCYPLYICHQVHTGKVISYAFPVYGKGLWSTIYGFLGLEPDATTIQAVAFYKHGETPGLGGEVSADWFQKSFKGKKIYDVVENRARPVQVIKGKVSEKMTGRDVDFAVDGITGATMTSKGVSEFLARWISVYGAYFEKVRISGSLE